MLPLVLEMDIVSRWSVEFWRHYMLELKRTERAPRRRKRFANRSSYVEDMAI